MTENNESGKVTEIEAVQNLVTAQTEKGAGFDAVQLILGFAGFGVSLYALLEHVKLKSTSGVPLSCDINDAVNCSAALSSKYSEVFEIPLGAFGMSFFGIVIALSFLGKMTDVSKKWLANCQLAVGAVGVAVAAVLAIISYSELKVVCPVCSTTHVISLVVFVWALVKFLKTRKSAMFAHPTAFMKFVSLSLALGVPPLIAGLLSPALAGVFGTKGSKPSEPDVPPKAVGTPFPSEWLTVSKSNFVGSGEDYRTGSDDAKVVLHMFSDFECPHCKTTSENIKEALSKVDSSKVLFVYRNFPLSNKCNKHVGSDGHKYACDLANASRCAGQQGKFWEFKDWVFSGIEMSAREKEGKFSIEGLVKKAAEFGMDGARMKQCLESKVEYGKIQEDASLGQKLGLQGTPLLILNGRKLEGVRNAQDLVAAFASAEIK